MTLQTTTTVAAGPTVGAGSEPALRISGLGKTFRRANGSTLKPIDDISLTIEKGEFLVLLGPSGCGKTTLLRSIAGLESPEEGSIEIHGRTVFDRRGKAKVNVPPEKRELGMIFQSYALWPHLTVARNVSYPLEAAGVPKADRAERVARVLAMVGISEIAEQVPGRLSGGQQQRVSLARALVGEPKVILFDEPLSNVDAKVREELRLQLVHMQQRLGFTAIYVTHDQVEAMELADRIAVLKSGRIAQLGEPEQIYNRPVSRYVAKFIGTANEVTGTVLENREDELLVMLPGGAAGGDLVPGLVSGEAAEAGDAVKVIWRPERTSVVAQETENGLGLAGTFVIGRYLGAYGEAIVELPDGTEVRAATARTPHNEHGSTMMLRVDVEDLRVFAAGDES